MTETTPSQTPEPKHRGTIVVDTDALYSLHATVAEGIKKDGAAQAIEQYFEVLPVLAKLGYEVKITEMVAYETERVLSDGSYTGKYFTPKNTKTPYPKLREFLQKAANKEIPGIEIIRVNTPQEIPELLSELRDVCKKYPESCDEAISRVDIIQESLKAVQKKGQQVPDRLSAGDQSNLAYIKSLGEATEAPIYLLTSDGEQLKTSAKLYPNAKLINASGLLEAISSSGLGNALGWSEKIDLESMHRDLQNQRYTGMRGQRPYVKFVTPVDATAERYLAEDKNRQKKYDKPFAKQLKQIVNETPDLQSYIEFPKEDPMPWLADLLDGKLPPRGKGPQR